MPVWNKFVCNFQNLIIFIKFKIFTIMCQTGFQFFFSASFFFVQLFKANWVFTRYLFHHSAILHFLHLSQHPSIIWKWKLVTFFFSYSLTLFYFFNGFRWIFNKFNAKLRWNLYFTLQWHLCIRIIFYHLEVLFFNTNKLIFLNFIFCILPELGLPKNLDS